LGTAAASALDQLRPALAHHVPLAAGHFHEAEWREGGKPAALGGDGLPRQRCHLGNDLVSSSSSLQVALVGQWLKFATDNRSEMQWSFLQKGM